MIILDETNRFRIELLNKDSSENSQSAKHQFTFPSLRDRILFFITRD